MKLFHRNWPLFLILLATMALMFVNGCAAKKVLVIDQSGAGDYTSIREALNDWKEGQDLIVKPGVYDEQIILQTNMNLHGTQGVTVRFSGEGPAMVGRDASNVKVKNLALQKAGGSNHPVVLLNSTDLSLTNSSISGSKTSGIEMLRYGNLDMKNCVIQNNGYAGLFFHHEARADIKDVSISKNGRGIEVRKYPDGIPQNQTIYRDEEGASIKVQRATIEDNSFFGVGIQMGSDIQLIENTIKNNGLLKEKVVLPRDAMGGQAGVIVDNRSTVTMEKNTITGNENGILFLTSGGGQVLSNLISDNLKLGILVEGSSQPTISGNDIAKNGTGMQFKQGAEATATGNRIRENKENGIEVLDSGRPVIERNWILRNEKVGVVIMRASKPRLRYNLLVENGWHGILAAQTSKPVVANNTFYRNAKIGAWFLENSEGAFVANVVVGSAIGLSIRKNLEVKPRIRGNCVWGNTQREYEGFLEIPGFDISKNPMFTDPARLDFTPMPGSPLVGAGGSDVVIGAIDPNAQPGS